MIANPVHVAAQRLRQRPNWSIGDTPPMNWTGSERVTLGCETLFTQTLMVGEPTTICTLRLPDVTVSVGLLKLAFAPISSDRLPTGTSRLVPTPVVGCVVCTVVPSTTALTLPSCTTRDMTPMRGVGFVSPAPHFHMPLDD